MYISMCACVPGRHTSVCVLYDRDHNRHGAPSWALGSFCESGFRVCDHMVSSLLSLLSLLVDRAFHTRADLPPCPVPLTGRRYGFPWQTAQDRLVHRLLFSRPRRGLVRRRLRCQPWPVHHQPRLIRRLSRARLMHCWPRLMRSRPLRCGRPVRLRCGLRRRFCPRPHRCHRRGLGRHRCRWLRHQLVRHPPRPRLQR